MDPLTIDGSAGEGGGQIVRTSVTVAALQGRTIELTNMRANRDPGGLKAQHLTCVRAAAQICAAQLAGDELGSTELLFEPQASPQGGRHHFDVAANSRHGSAGAATLVLQTVLPALGRACDDSTVVVEGGTHVRFSPSFEYLQSVYGPFMKRIGFDVEFELKKCGFYPAGGGKIEARIAGKGADWPPDPLQLKQRGAFNEYTIESLVEQRLPDHIRKRQAETAASFIEEKTERTPRVENQITSSDGPGTAVFLHGNFANTVCGFTDWGERGKPAETVAEEPARELVQYHESQTPVDRYLADQLLLPLSFASGSSCYRAERITEHVRTSASLLQTFGLVDTDLDDTLVTVTPE